MDTLAPEGKNSECDDLPRLQEKHTKLHHDFYNLKARLTRTLEAVRNGNCTLEQTADDLAAMNSDLNGVEDYVRFRLQPKYYNEIRGEDCSIAERVFNIPELLEHILLTVDVPGTISMERTNRAIRSGIAASSKLQIELCLQPGIQPLTQRFRYRSPFGFPEEQFPTFRVALLHGRLQAIFSREDYRGLPKITTREAKMLICQPPIKHMKLIRSCPQWPTGDMRWADEISSDTGLTVGDLYALSIPVLAGPHSCSNCSTLSHDSQQDFSRTETSEVMFLKNIY